MKHLKKFENNLEQKLNVHDTVICIYSDSSTLVLNNRYIVTAVFRKYDREDTCCVREEDGKFLREIYFCNRFQKVEEWGDKKI